MVTMYKYYRQKAILMASTENRLQHVFYISPANLNRILKTPLLKSVEII